MQIHATVLRQTPLGDVHVRHHFQARDDGCLQHAQLRRNRDLMQNPIDPIADAQIVFERLDMNIRRTLHYGFADNLIHELHHRRFRVIRNATNLGFAKIYQDKTAITAADALNDKVLPFFIKQEADLDFGKTDIHGADGPITVKRASEDDLSPVSETFVEACAGVANATPSGEAIAHAAAFNRLRYYPDDANVKLGFNFNIKTLIAIAPVDPG